VSRYKVTGPWSDESSPSGSFQIQVADITDTHNGTEYREGAWRVIDLRTSKPAVTGKGGTVPFYGEMAWADAERLAMDLAMKERFR
jgi:hypothetical protein